jgi:phage baseplate assembly protein V
MNIKDIDSRIARKLASIRQPFRCNINLVNSVPNVSLIQGGGLAGEKVQDNEIVQHFGFSSNPPAGSTGIVLPLGGKTSQAVIIATEHASYRIKSLKSGEVAIYSDEGDMIVLKRGRLIEATTDTFKINASNKVEMNTPLLQVNGGDIKADTVSLKHHKNKGVMTGTALSDEPQA